MPSPARREGWGEGESRRLRQRDVAGTVSTPPKPQPNPLSCGRRFLPYRVTVMLRVSRDLTIDENDIEIVLCPRLRSGRTERQQGLDRGAAPLRHDQDHAAGRRGATAGAAGRQPHDQGRRDRDPGVPVSHPGTQPRRCDRAAARDAEEAWCGRRRGGRPSRRSALQRRLEGKKRRSDIKAGRGTRRFDD